MHNRNAVRYFVIIATVLLFLFLSNDFGLIDVQKTAIVTAVGVDKEGDEFIVSSQIAMPVSEGQQSSTKTVLIVSKGNTVSAALEKTNGKTGWYPKLVFCKLLLLGEETVKSNVFDVLDFFLRDEYISEDCLVAACEGTAQEVLNASTPIGNASGQAIEKILSAHAERVGSAMPNTLRGFASSSLGESKSGYLPLLKAQSLQEQTEKSGGTEEEKEQSGSSENSGSSGSSGSQSESAGSGSSSSSGGAQKSGEGGEEKAFKANQTSLFLNGISVQTLTKDETFAFASVKTKLKLAPYTVAANDKFYTLTIKHNNPKIKLSVEKNGTIKLDISVSLVAGIADFSKAEDENEISDAGDIPSGVFAAAERTLKEQIERTFDKCRQSKCDLFGLTDLLRKYDNKYYEALKNDLMDRTTLSVAVRFQSVR